MRREKVPTDLLISQLEIEEVEIVVRSKVKDVCFGEHKSVFTGSGFDFSGLKEWQPGDRQSAIDWAHSTHTGFNPLIVREYVEEKSVDVMIVADRSLSMRCGTENMHIGNIVARVIATLGFSAVIFQDRIGLTAFNEKLDYVCEFPRGGKNNVFNLLNLYLNTASSVGNSAHGKSLSSIISSSLRRMSLVPVISDFIFSNSEAVIVELSDIAETHDVLLILIDSAFLFEMPRVSAGWIKCLDIETGDVVMLSRKEYEIMAGKVKHHQSRIKDFAEKKGLEVLVIEPDIPKSQQAVVDFFFQRRLQNK